MFSTSYFVFTFLVFGLTYASIIPHDIIAESHQMRHKRYVDVFNLDNFVDPSCEVIKYNKHARFEEVNIDQDAYSRAIRNEYHYDMYNARKLQEKHKKISNSLSGNSQIKELLCDPDNFFPHVSKLKETVQFSCSQMCQRCLPGSYPICYMKSRLYPGIAQTCLCTYAPEDPVQKAAFSLKTSRYNIFRKLS